MKRPMGSLISEVSMNLKIVYFVFLLFMISCSKPSSSEQIKTEDILQKNIFKDEVWRQTHDLSKNYFFIQEDITKECFIYFHTGFANGGPALGNISCEKIPKELIHTIKNTYLN
jgi:hypothetical protein